MPLLCIIGLIGLIDATQQGDLMQIELKNKTDQMQSDS